MRDSVGNLGNQLFQIRMLEAEGKDLQSLEDDVWREIQDQIERESKPKQPKKHKRAKGRKTMVTEQKETSRRYLTPGTWLIRLEAQKSLVLDQIKEASAQMLALQIQTWKLNARLGEFEHMERNALIAECSDQIVKYYETDELLFYESQPRRNMGFHPKEVTE